MPKSVHKLATKLNKKGYSKKSSWAIANSVINRRQKVTSGRGR